MENALMSLRTATPDKNPLHSVPPIFASGDHGRHAPHPAHPGNPDPASKVARRPEDTTPGGDALNDSGEDNHRQQQG